MEGARRRAARYSQVIFALLIMLAAVRLAPSLIEGYRFLAAVRPLFRAISHSPARDFDPCAGWEAEASSHLAAPQRLVIGSLVRAAGCLEQAARILPAFTAAGERAALLAYQWGLIAWQRGDAVGAAEMWRQGQDIDRRLLFQAQWTSAPNLEEAQRRYEAAIMAARSPQMQAEAITAYTEGLRGRMPAEAFRARLAYLESYFGADTAIGRRLAGQRAWWEGSYEAAFKQLAHAITLGFADAETWYLLGEAAWKLGDLPAAEGAYRSALDAAIQIPGRRAWHLHRLASLLVANGRLDEALVFQQEAARLSDYYLYSDQLAVFLARLGQQTQAQAACARARATLQARAVQVKLQCEARSFFSEGQP